jgi:cyclopropane-fatty-acyl-phospholipid synthase
MMGPAGFRTAASRAVVEQMLARLRGGTVTLHETGTDRARTPFGDPSTPEPTAAIAADVSVHDPRVYERVIRQGSVGLGESYADGWWDAEDLTAFLRLTLRNLRTTHGRRDRFHRLVTPVVDPLLRLRRPDPARDARQVRAHYDLGNDFFARLLDETMAYSCAVFDRPGISLADASRAKFDRLAGLLDLQPGDRLLEIGTGWAGFALHAARRYGCLVTTTTISPRQYEHACARVADAGLEDRVTVLDVDYRDLRGTYDKAIAIEMIEAVDWRDYPAFFEHVRGALTDDGALAMQAIVAADDSFDRLKRRSDFIKAAIFPGGCLPSVEALTGSAASYGGLALQHHTDIGLHYAETVRRWRANLDATRADLPTLGLDARFGRLWTFYLAYCEAGFDERYISAVQLLYGTEAFAARARPRHAARMQVAANDR